MDMKKELSSLKNSLINSDGFYAWLGVLFLAGFTPLPYKVFTIASGLIGFNILIFILISLISRGLRFFLLFLISRISLDIYFLNLWKNMEQNGLQLLE